MSLTRILILALIVISIPAHVARAQVVPAATLPSVEVVTPTTLPTTMPTAEQAAQIETFLTQLSDANIKPADRDAAVAKLAALGDAARDALSAKITAGAIPKTVQSAFDIQRMITPTMVTLNLTDASAVTILAELSKVTGFDLRPYNEANFQNASLPKSDVAIDNQPFWTAMRDICNKAGIAPYNPGNQERRLLFLPTAQLGQSFLKFPSCTSGAFLITASSMQRSSSVELGADPATPARTMTLQMQVFCEPKIRVLQYSYMPDIDEAVDEKGNSLVAAKVGGGGTNYAAGRGSLWSVSVQLQYRDDVGEMLTRLRGKLRFVIQTRSETLEFDKMATAKDISKTVSGKRVVMKELKKLNDRQYQVSLVFYRDGMQDREFYDLASNPAIQLLDAQGHPYICNGTSASNNSGQEYQSTLSFYRQNRNEGGAQDVGDPALLRWEVPVESQEVAIPFEFENLPLP